MTGCRGRGALTSSSIDQLQEEDSKYGESTTAAKYKGTQQGICGLEVQGACDRLV